MQVPGITSPGECPTDLPSPLRVFLLLGQSNMVGHAHGWEFDRALSDAHPRILTLQEGQWQQHRPYGYRNGPEVSFSRAIAEAYPEDTIGLIKIAIGGTGIRAFLPEWTEEGAALTRDVAKGPIYQRHILPAIQSVLACEQGDFSGVLWKQGGSDTLNEAASQDHLQHLETLVAALRADTQTPELPFLIGTYYDDATLDHFENTRAADVMPFGKAVLRAHNALARTTPHVFTIPHGDLPTRSDNKHFTTQGQVELGELFAESFLESGGFRNP